MKKQTRIYINDVTLREGDQAPLTSFTKNEKKVIALILAEIGVDCMELGFGRSRADFENIRWVIEDFSKSDDDKIPFVSSLWRSLEEDSIASIEALKWAKKTRIHSFIATSDSHINAKFEKFWKNLEERKLWVKDRVEIEVKRLREALWKDGQVEFSPEDATNSDFDYLLEIIKTAIKSGANIINVPDTLWSFLPHETEKFFAKIVEKTNYLKEEWYEFEFSCHIHNDLAVSSANAISSLRWWARWIETTLNWIWERTWNTNLAEIIWILTEKKESVLEDSEVNLPKINKKLLWPATYLIDRILNYDKSLQRPFVWQLSDKDGSGVHNASANVYWWTKNKKDFGWIDLEEFFSPRWWANQIISMLEKFKVKEDKKSEVIEKLTNLACIEAEIVKWVYSGRLYSMYLELKREFKILSCTISWKEVSVCLKLFDKEFCISWQWEWENWIINWMVNAINYFLWEEIIEIEEIKVYNKPNLKDSLEKFFEDVNNVWACLSEFAKNKLNVVAEINSLNSQSKQVWVVALRLKVSWKVINIRTFWTDVQKESIKAIIYGSLYEIGKKVS